MSELSSLQAALEQFASARDWSKFHTHSNLAKAISIEASELLENFLWEEPPMTRTGFRERLAEEVADVMIYCLLFCSAADIEPADAIRAKMAINAEKYPIEKCKGRATKYDRL